MSKETTSMEYALLLRLGKMVKENVELEQRVHQLVDDYNAVVRQQNKQKERVDEKPAKQTLGQMFWMRDHCDESEKENESLKKYVKAVDSFMRDKQLYMPKGISCPYVEGNPTVGSMPCLECDSCLHLLYGIGVVCRQVLNAARIDSEKSVKQN